MEETSIILRNAAPIAAKPHLSERVFGDCPAAIEREPVVFVKILEDIILHFRQAVFRAYPQQSSRIQIQGANRIVGETVKGGKMPGGILLRKAIPDEGTGQQQKGNEYSSMQDRFLIPSSFG